MMKCYACNKAIVHGELLCCCVCRRTYDYRCLNMSTEFFVCHFNNNRAWTWQCQSCSNNSQHFFNTQMSNQIAVHNANIRAPLEYCFQTAAAATAVHSFPAAPHMPNDQYGLQMYNNRSGFATTGLEGFMDQLNIFTSDLVSSAVNTFQHDFFNKTKSFMFLNVEMNKRLASFPSEQTKPKSQFQENQTLSTSEKFTRSQNVEIQLIPETENENLVEILKNLCYVIKAPFNINDVRMIRRISKIDPHSNRPRNIIVSLATQLHRDILISSFRRYNKNNKTEPLNSSHIGIPGDKCNIYLTEHLTPECKAIHLATRKIAKERGYAYVWVRNDDVFVRKNDQSPAILIRNIDDAQILQ